MSVACVQYVASHPVAISASFGLTVGYGLFALGYADKLASLAAQKIFHQWAKVRESVRICGETETKIGNGNTAYLRRSNRSWRIEIIGANQMRRVISLEGDMCGPPMIIPHHKGFVATFARVVRGDTPRFQVSAQIYNTNGFPVGSKMDLSPPVPLNVATVPNPIAAIAYGRGSAIAWQETPIGAITSRFAGVVIDEKGITVPFKTGSHRSFDGPPLLSDLGKGGLGLSWAAEPVEGGSNEIFHYFQRISIKKKRSSEPMVIGGHNRGQDEDFEPSIGNQRERAIAPFGDGFVYVRRPEVHGGRSPSARTILGTVFDWDGRILHDFSMQISEKYGTCYPKIKQIAANAIDVLCRSTKIWYTETFGNSAARCQQKVFEWWEGKVTLPEK